MTTFKQELIKLIRKHPKHSDIYLSDNAIAEHIITLLSALYGNVELLINQISVPERELVERWLQKKLSKHKISSRLYHALSTFTYMDEITPHVFWKCPGAGKKTWIEFQNLKNIEP